MKAFIILHFTAIFISIGITRTKANLLLSSGVSSFLKRLEGFTAKRKKPIIDAELKKSAQVYQFPYREAVAL